MEQLHVTSQYFVIHLYADIGGKVAGIKTSINMSTGPLLL